MFLRAEAGDVGAVRAIAAAARARYSAAGATAELSRVEATLAELQLDRGEHRAVERQARATLALDAADAGAHLLLAEALMARGAWPDASRELAAAGADDNGFTARHDLARLARLVRVHLEPRARAVVLAELDAQRGQEVQAGDELAAFYTRLVLCQAQATARAITACAESLSRDARDRSLFELARRAAALARTHR
jgi:hypothetical protein